MVKRLNAGIDVTRRSALAGVLLLAVSANAQDDWPSKPLKIVIPTAVGGPNDIVARILAEALRAEIKQPVLIDNRLGASGTIGANFVAKSPPDGYTLFWGSGSTHVIAPAMMKGVPYDPVKDFVPICFVGPAPFVLYVRASLPVKNMSDLVALAKSKPGQLSFGTNGPATVHELAALTLEAQAGVQFNHVPYKGSAPMVLDLAGDRLDMGVGAIDGSSRNERVRSLALMGTRRSEFLPDVPTVAEQGFPDYMVPAWAGVWAPAATPAAVCDRLTAAMRTVLSRKEIQDKVNQSGISVEFKDPAGLRKLMSDGLHSVLTIMRNAKIEPI